MRIWLARDPHHPHAVTPERNNKMATTPLQRTIVFSHANSFPAHTYQMLFEHWQAQGYTVHAIEQYGHDPRYPVTADWPHLVAQLRDFIAREVGHPVFLVGHSLGGYLSLMLASQYPQWSQGVVVLDSPILQGWRSAALGLAKRIRVIDRVMPSHVAKKRTHEWPSLAAAQHHFGIKPRFAAFHPRILEDYLLHGLEHQPEHPTCRLRYQRDIEASIYSTMPHRLLTAFRKQPHQCPLAFIAGTDSRELRRGGLQGARQLFGSQVSWIAGSHLYPFESPERTSHEVLRWLAHFEALGSTECAVPLPTPTASEPQKPTARI